MAQEAWRRVTSATWRAPRDPSAYADVSTDATALLETMRRAADAGWRITPTVLVVRALGHALQKVPEANLAIRWGRAVPRSRIDAWVTMTGDGGRLFGRRIDAIHERDLADIQREVDAAGNDHRGGTYAASRRAHAVIRLLPTAVLRWAIRLAGFLIHDLRLGVPGMGVDRHGFGAVHVTNVGPMGIRHAAAPIPPVTRQTILIVVGEIHDAPTVRDGQVVASPLLPMTATLDHRAMVGTVGGALLRAFRGALADPDLLASFLPQGPAGRDGAGVRSL